MFRKAASSLTRAPLAAVGTAGCAYFAYPNRAAPFVTCEPKPLFENISRFFKGSAKASVSCAAAPDVHIPLVMCGPSGVGKGTLIKILMQEYPDQFGFSVSSTTRKPRPGEVDGTHYNFVDYDVMEQEINEGKFVEHAKVHDKFYGTSVAAVETLKSKKQIAILDIDTQGAESIKAKLPALYLFLHPPSMDVLEARLRGRGTETEDKLQIRLANAVGEIEFSKKPGFFDLHLVADEEFKTALPEVRAWLESMYPQLKK